MSTQTMKRVNAGVKLLRKPWRADEDEAIIRLRKEGKRYRDIASIIGRGYQATMERIHEIYGAGTSMPKVIKDPWPASVNFASENLNLKSGTPVSVPISHSDVRSNYGSAAQMCLTVG